MKENKIVQLAKSIKAPLQAEAPRRFLSGIAWIWVWRPSERYKMSDLELIADCMELSVGGKKKGENMTT